MYSVKKGCRTKEGVKGGGVVMWKKERKMNVPSKGGVAAKPLKQSSSMGKKKREGRAGGEREDQEASGDITKEGEKFGGGGIRQGAKKTPMGKGPHHQPP